MVVDKKVKLELCGRDGNAFSLMGAFQQAARRQGWSKEEIDLVLKECQAGDYNHLLCTLMDHCESPDDIDSGEDEDKEFEEDESKDEEEHDLSTQEVLARADADELERLKESEKRSASQRDGQSLKCR